MADTVWLDCPRAGSLGAADHQGPHCPCERDGLDVCCWCGAPRTLSQEQIRAIAIAAGIDESQIDELRGDGMVLRYFKITRRRG